MTRPAPDEDMMREIVLRVMNEMKEASEPKPIEPKPKRQLSEKQLAALAAGRAKNPKYKPRTQ